MLGEKAESGAGWEVRVCKESERGVKGVTMSECQVSGWARSEAAMSTVATGDSGLRMRVGLTSMSRSKTLALKDDEL